MADTKISALTAASALDGTELLAGVQGGANVKILVSAVKTLVLAGAAAGTILAGATPAFTATPVLGVAGATVGTLGFENATSGRITLSPPAGALGTVTCTLPLGGTLATLGANVFTTLQTITQANANTGILASTGYSLTGSDATNMIDLAGTWNTSGTPSAFKINITDTASNAASLLIDVGTGGGSYVSTFQVKKGGQATAAGSITLGGDLGLEIYTTLAKAKSRDVTGRDLTIERGGLHLASAATVGWSANGVTGGVDTFTSDTILKRGGAAATLQMGNVDAATAVAQTFKVQGVVAGTTNVAGANWTFSGSVGTGTGAGGQIILRTAPAGSTGTAQNALATGLTITAPGINMQPSVVLGNQALATTATDGFLYIPTCAGTPTGVPTAHTGRVPIIFDDTNNKLYIYDGSWLGGTTPGAFI